MAGWRDIRRRMIHWPQTPGHHVAGGATPKQCRTWWFAAVQRVWIARAVFGEQVESKDANASRG